MRPYTIGTRLQQQQQQQQLVLSTAGVHKDGWTATVSYERSCIPRVTLHSYGRFFKNIAKILRLAKAVSAITAVRLG